VWVGTNLFAPGIIKLCQVTNQSQFAVSRLFWLIAALDGLYRAETLFGAILFGGLSLMMMVTASLRADSPTISFVWFRMAALVLLGLAILTGVRTGAWAGIEFWVFILIAEYAATIKTIPPQESRKEAAVAAEAPKR
jgi:hypothetical protein